MSSTARRHSWTTAALLAALYGLGAAPIAAAAPRPLVLPACSPGQWIVDGAPLVSGAPAAMKDVVALEAGAPHVSILSGCPQTAVRPKRSGKDGMKLDVRFRSCGRDGRPLRFSGRITGDCETMTGHVSRRGERRRTFVARRPPDPNARVKGTVEALRQERHVAIPGVRVHLEDAEMHVPVGAAVTTNDDGQYEIYAKPGRYDVCMSAPGFVSRCDREPVVIDQPPTAYIVRDLLAIPDGGAIDGRLRLADGARCHHDSPQMSGRVAGLVRATGRPELTVQVNGKGEYVLPLAGVTGRLTVQAECASETKSFARSVGPDELSGATMVDLAMDNHSPQIARLIARDATGRALRKGTPGATLTAEAQAIDADGDALYYFWRDGNERVVSTNTPAVPWALLDVEASNVVNVEVTDARGGYARERLVIDTSASGDRFSGRVTGPTGAVGPIDGPLGGTPVIGPLANTEIVIDGVRTVTDADGEFSLEVPERERHVLSARRPGYALVSRVLFGEAADLAIVLRAGTRGIVTPQSETEVGEAGGVTVRLPVDALVDDLGTPAAGAVQMSVTAYRPGTDELPGNRAARTPDGKTRAFTPLSAVWVDFHDAGGRRYELAAGRVARVTFPAPANAPAVAKLMHYDEAAATWTEEGRAALVNGRYEALVRGFSAWAVGDYTDGAACLELTVDEFALDRPFVLRLETFDGWEHKSFGPFDVTEKKNVFHHLPEFSIVTMHVSPLSEPNYVKSYGVAATAGPAQVGDEPPYPFEGCTTGLLTQRLPSNSFLTKIGHGTPEGATEYYAKIGAPKFFDWWLQNNGFDLEHHHESDVSFFNPNEIGLGRRVNCNMMESPDFRIACYVTKFGHVGGSPKHMLEQTIAGHDPGDTVAMEYASGPNGGPRFTKFFIYGPDGMLKQHTAFDTEGDVKYVPNVCAHCHGGYEQSDGYRFNTLDPTLYEFAKSGPGSREAQEERIRLMNQMISYTFKRQGPYWEQMNTLYQGEVDTPNAVAQPIPPPDASWAGHEEVWEKVTKPACRTCHIYQSPAWNMREYGHAVRVGSKLVCGGQMPNAMSPMLKLWKTTDPFMPSWYVSQVSYYGETHCGPEGNLPVVSITSPLPGATVHGGGLNMITFRADVSDVDDGASCCAVRWSVGDATLGYGTTLETALPGSGDQTVTATVTDKDGNQRTDEITLHVLNDAPEVTITKPAAGAVVYAGVPVTLQGIGHDVNEPLFEIPCAKLEWSTSNPADPPKTGCNPSMTFATPGGRTLTLTGTDSSGVVGFDQILVQVVTPAANQAPSVQMVDPFDGEWVNPYENVYPFGQAKSPDGSGGPITYQWFIDGQPAGNSMLINWIPADTVPFTCGGTAVTVRLEATNANGKGIAEATVWVGFEPC